MIIKNGLIYDTEKRVFIKKDIRVSEGVISDLSRATAGEEVFDAEGYTVVPGLIDVHTHGRIGYEFTDCPDEKLHEVARSYAELGVTTVMPTLASAPFPKMLEAIRLLSEYTAGTGEANFCGVHVEGRYLNVKKRGAHAEALLAALDPRELENEVFRMCPRLHISAAFELDDGSFARKALSIGATLGLAHTAATYAEAKRAEEWGVRSYTHLFNAMTPLHHRDGGAVCAAFEGDAYTELIGDGFHISPEMVRLTYRLKGVDRLTLISDSIQAAGCPDGDYASLSDPYYVKDGRAYTYSSGAVAGSTSHLGECLNNLIDFCGIPLSEAIISATATPAKQVGVYDRCGSIDEGKRADLLFLHGCERLDIEKIMLRGEFIRPASHIN